MSHLANTLLKAMAHTGRGPKAAWIMGRACYLYTRSHDGDVVDVHGTRISFGRWYSFCEAVRCGWHYLWPRSE